MKERILKFLMIKGVEIFTDYVPTRIMRRVMGDDVDFIKFRNDLTTVTRQAAKESWKLQLGA